jgi:hypothetical protein
MATGQLRKETAIAEKRKPTEDRLSTTRPEMSKWDTHEQKLIICVQEGRGLAGPDGNTENLDPFVRWLQKCDKSTCFGFLISVLCKTGEIEVR